MEEKDCPRTTDALYVKPKTAFDIGMVRRTDQCIAERKDGKLGQFGCVDCKVRRTPKVITGL